MSEIRVLLLEDDTLMRSTLTKTLATYNRFAIESTASVKVAIELFHSFKPDCLLADVHLGEGPTGIDLAVMLRKLNPNLGIVILTSFEDPRLSRTELPLPIGSIYLVKQSLISTDAIAESVTQSVNNARHQLHSLKDTNRLSLTDIQLETMKLIAAGKSNAEIARIRFVTEKAVEKSIRTLAEKLVIPQDSATNLRALITRSYYQMTGGKD